MSVYVPPAYDAIDFDSFAVVYIPPAYNQIDFDPLTGFGFQFPWAYFMAIAPQ